MANGPHLLMPRALTEPLQAKNYKAFLRLNWELKKLKNLAMDGFDIGQATGSKSCKFIMKAIMIF
jgi:hypothetical protein